MKIALFPGQFALRHPFRAPEDDQGHDEGPQPITNGGEEDEPEPTPEPEPEPAPAAAETALEGDPAPEGEEEPLAAEDEEEPATSKRRDWGAQRRIDKLTAERKALAQERDDAIARAKTLEELYAKPEGERSDGEREAIRLQVRNEESARIREEMRVQSLNKAADKLFDDGARAFPNTWEKRVTELRDLFGEELGKRPDFLEAVTDLDNAPAVWHELGADPETMDRLLQLPPARMGIELAKLSGKLSVPKPRAISAAPAPIRPLDKQAVEELPLDDDRVSMEEFVRRREAQEAKRAS